MSEEKPPEKVEIAGAITYPKQNENQAQAIPVQPKQPTNLQGLLRFAMEATKAEDAPHQSHMQPIDQEKKKFLEQALNSMTVDVIKILQEKMKVLQNADKLNADRDISEHIQALDTILDFIDDTDTANDFHKIGGFSVFRPCLKSVHHELRAKACEVLAELCQNNPYCQRVVLDGGFVPVLVRILSNDESNPVCVKALYAVSCIVRQNAEAFSQLVQYQGLTVLLKTFQKDDDKLRTKTAFLLAALCRSQRDLKSRLVFLEYIPALIRVLSEERKPSHEHILSLLLVIVEDNYEATIECRNPRHNFKEVLDKHLEVVQNKPEFEEEATYCRELIRIIFPQRNGVS